MPEKVCFNCGYTEGKKDEFIFFVVDWRTDESGLLFCSEECQVYFKSNEMNEKQQLKCGEI